MGATAAALRAEVAQLPRRYRGERYPPELRARLTREARRLLRQGLSVWRVGQEFGLHGATVERWCLAEPVARLVPVEVVPLPADSIESPTPVESLAPTAVESPAPTPVESLEPVAVESLEPVAVELPEPVAAQSPDPTPVGRPEPLLGSLAVTSPAGWRVEGLDMVAVVELLRVFG